MARSIWPYILRVSDPSLNRNRSILAEIRRLAQSRQFGFDIDLYSLYSVTR